MTIIIIFYIRIIMTMIYNNMFIAIMVVKYYCIVVWCVCALACVWIYILLLFKLPRRRLGQNWPTVRFTRIARVRWHRRRRYLNFIQMNAPSPLLLGHLPWSALYPCIYIIYTYINEYNNIIIIGASSIIYLYCGGVESSELDGEGELYSRNRCKCIKHYKL